MGASDNAETYVRSNYNNGFGMRRLTSKRKPEIPGLHEQLCANQARFIKDHRHVFDAWRRLYEPYFLEFRGSEEEATEHYDDPHDKRELRRQAMAELRDSGELFSGKAWIRGTIWKTKIEKAKPGKKIRLVMDLGVPASLRGFVMFKLLKQAQDETLHWYKCGFIEFCKSPKLSRLHDVFESLRNPAVKFHFVCFSDDSVLALRLKDGTIVRFNIDISSCDASNGYMVFEALRWCFPKEMDADIQLIIDQCKAPLTMRSVSNRRHKVVLKPEGPVQNSGSTATTGINNVASFCICMAIIDRWDREIFTPGLIEAGAADAGYIVTGGEPLDNFESVQFLKHSPTLDTQGVYRPVLNVGVLVRATGSCYYDLPGSGPLEPRAMIFQRSVVTGMYPRTDFLCKERMLRATECQCTLTTRQQQQLSAAVKRVIQHKVSDEEDDYPVTTYHSEDLYRRYNLSPAEIGMMDEEYATLKYGEYLHSTALTKILKLDYGLETVEYSSKEYQDGCTYTSLYP